MICAFSPYAEKCQCCCKYFGAYWTFCIQIVQLFCLLFIFIFIIATNKYLKEEEKDLKKAATMTIVAFVFNILHNIVTIAMSRYRDDVAADIVNAESLLCCYTLCPSCACCWDTLLGVFTCSCVFNCFDFYIFQYHWLLIFGLAQFILAVITAAVGLNAAKLVSNAKKKDLADSLSLIVLAFTILLLIFTIINFLCNLICMIRFIVERCKGMTFKKRENSEKEDQPDDDEKPEQNENEQKPTEPNQNQNQNQENDSNPIDVENQNDDDNKIQNGDPEDKA